MTKHLLLFFSFLILFSCNNNKQENKSKETYANAKQDTLYPLQVTILAEIPDSLQPKTILLENMPKPVTVVVPKTKSGSYSVTNAKGEVKKINLEPPVTVLPPLLKDKNGEVIKDKDGNPIILGDGGISNFTTYTTDNGLALDAISSFCMDHFGNLWFGTLGAGVSRYDGKSFTSFTSTQGLIGKSVLSITEDKQGNLWFGTEGGGVSRYNGKSFVSFTSSQGLAGNRVFCITEDKHGNLWFGTEGGGVSRYDGKSFVSFSSSQGLAGNSVWSITEDNQGNLWFGTESGGVSRYDGKSFANFTSSQGLAGNSVRCITEDKHGNLWFGTEGGEVSRYDGKSFVSFSSSPGLAGNSIRSIVEDKHGNLWFGTDGGGVSRYDGKSFVNFTSSQGLAGNRVLCIKEDQQGNVWFGTLSGGVSRYDGKSFVSFTSSQGLASNIVRSIAEDKQGNLWLGTYGGGVSRYDGKSFLNFTSSQGLAAAGIRSITEDRQGCLWFGTDGGGVSRYDGKSFVSFSSSQGLAGNRVFSITEDKQGNLWFGTDGGGVSRYDGRSFVSFTSSQGLAGNNIRSITEDKQGKLWFGTLGQGVCCYDGKCFIRFTSSQGLAGNRVWSITEDKQGNIWFGTEAGLSLLNVESMVMLSKFMDIDNCEAVISTTRLFKNFTTADGLPDNFVTQVLEDSVGRIYVGTNVGICELTGSGSAWKVRRVFNSSAGYPVKDVNVGQHTMFRDSKGMIWIATGSEKTALVRFDPKAVHKNNQPPKVIIQKIRIGEASVCWYSLVRQDVQHDSLKGSGDSVTIAQQELMSVGKVFSALERDSLKRKYAGVEFDSIPAFYPIPANLVLPYQHNSVSFDFVALETGVNFSVRYQYILEGYSKEWSPVTDKTTAIFGNINEGTYTFKLKARSPEGVWSEPVTYTFIVLPPWWRTWWAYTMYALLFLYALRVFVKWRERNLRKEKEKLEHTVEIRTAEVVAEKKEVEKQKQRSDELLLNILPVEVAEELKAKGSTDAKQFDEVTVMFTDFKNFSRISEKLSPAELVSEIDTCFKAFDNIITKHNIEKIKTIGDSYMCAGGLPIINTTNAIDVVNAALEIQLFMQQHLVRRNTECKECFEIRIGIHTGPVVAGIVGVKKFAYDIWGDTVNIASRMESSGEAGKVNISSSTYELVKGKFSCTHRGKIEAKNKGMIDMYFVESIT